MASKSGEIRHPCTSHYHVKLQVSSKERTSGKAAKDLWLCQKDQTLFNQIQDLPNTKHDWSYTVYGNVQEIIPNNCLKPLGKSATTTTTLDANLLHCLATGASLTACLHFCNQTPIDWYSKKQATVETATYGSEFVAAKTATEHIMDLRYTLRYLGVPINSKSYMFGDNRLLLPVLPFNIPP